MDRKTKEALSRIVGSANVSDAMMDLVTYSYDFSDFCCRPQGAVWPTTTEQVAEIMRLANRERFPVIPRGAGTGATGMVVPVAGGIVLDFVRMNRILKIAIEDRLVIVQPGVVHGDLQKALESHGFFFPPDPASGKVATLGGNVATNAGGLKGAKYGTTRDYVLALQVVLPSGETMRVGSNCMKSVSGYDLTRLFVGSEGTLGVITEMTLKISPKPVATSTALASFERLTQAGSAVEEIMRSGIIPSVCELLDRHIIHYLIDRAGLAIPRSGAMILVETDGYTEAEANSQMARIIDVFGQNHAVEIRRAAGPGEIEGLWKARKSMGGVIGRIKPNFLVEDVTVPISKMTALLEGIEAISGKYGVEIVNFGHAGDGNLHPHLLYDGSNPEETKRVEAATAALFELACELGGTLTGEHGIGLSKAPFMGLEHDPVAMAMMRSLKAFFDPHDILNPGKMGLAEAEMRTAEYRM
jgi:glycolate oxidase